jgi:flavin reductase (DIM6/NTAB) family NADH-FMN oxidoreductase RutF
MASAGDWIQLTEGKQFSRLLYTNPVCFLCCSANAVASNLVAPTPSSTDDNNNTITATASEVMQHNSTEPARLPAFRNVMVLSWLTATNNSGRFMFSLNRRRYSSGLVNMLREFVLAVPVQGMEELLTAVGGVSGRFGSKFPADYDSCLSTDASATQQPVSKRQRRKEPRFRAGIPKLKRVLVGTNQAMETSDTAQFAIEGTVAHLVCRVHHIVSQDSPLLSDVIDDDHDLIVALVVQAHVHKNYWDATKNIFRPAAAKPAVPPYLTFFGSQTFGYILPASSLPEPLQANAETAESDGLR